MNFLDKTGTQYLIEKIKTKLDLKQETISDLDSIRSNASIGAGLKTKVDGIASNANNYSLPNATTSSKGGVIVGSNLTVSSGTLSITSANVTAALGYTPPTTNTTYGTATTTVNGLMTSAMVTKLNGIASSATAVTSSTVEGWGFTKTENYTVATVDEINSIFNK